MTRTEYNKSVDLFSDNIYRFILKSINDEEVAKDIVQETYTKLWVKHESVTFEKVKSYLFTTSYHTLVDYTRKEKRSTRIEESHEKKLFHENQYSDLKEILNEAILGLSEKQRSAILLRDYEGYSYKEISDTLSISEAQVKVNIYRARKFLQHYLKSIETVI